MATKPMPIIDYITRMNQLYGNDHAAEHRPTVQATKKTDPTAGAVYTSKLDQVAYPIPGTAPAEKKLIKWALEESPEPIVKNPVMKKAITDAEIQKKLDKLRGPSDWDVIYGGMSPQEKGSHNAEKRKQGMNGKTAEPINKVDDYGPVKYDKNGLPNKATPKQVGAMAEKFEEMRQMTGSDERYDKPKPKKINAYADVKIPVPVIDYALLRESAADKARAAALEKTRAYAFAPRPDPDANSGIGSFKKTIGRKLRAENSKRDWQKRSQTIYKG